MLSRLKPLLQMPSTNRSPGAAIAARTL